MKKFKEFIKESSGYTQDAENKGMYDQMGTLLQKVEELLGEMPDSPEDALEMLNDNSIEVPTFKREELYDSIQELIDEIDSTEAETFYNMDEEDEAFESVKFVEFLLEYVEPSKKDLMRIDVLNDRAKDEDHFIKLVTNMANAIGRNMEPGTPKALKAADKAEGRGNAAEDGNYHDAAEIFFDRAKELRGE